jgi:hypothetical protein
VEPSSTVSSLVDAPARLSPAQKRDLVGQAVAAVMTTALIAAPLITPVDAVLPAQSFAGPVPAVAFANTQTPPELARAMRPATRSKPGTPARLVTNSLSTVGAQPLAVATSGSLGVAADSPAVPRRKPLSQRLTGWLVGDGTQSIRPFPSVNVAAVRP